VRAFAGSRIRPPIGTQRMVSWDSKSDVPRFGGSRAGAPASADGPNGRGLRDLRSRALH
jgi:hypothetical protein